MVEDQRKEHCICGCYQRLALASSIASRLRATLCDRLGLTASAGIAHNKVLAKLIGKTHKPNQQTTIFPTYATEFLGGKRIREISGIYCLSIEFILWAKLVVSKLIKGLEKCFF